MSQEIREKALAASLTYVGLLIKNQADYDVVKIASTFADYIAGNNDNEPAPEKTKPTGAKAPVEKPATEKAKPVTKPAAEKAKPVTAKAPKKDEVNPDLKKMVGDKVNECLKANLRDPIVDLLASFDGAQSATGIVLQGQEAIDSFMEQADSLLAAAAEEGGLAD